MSLPSLTNRPSVGASFSRIWDRNLKKAIWEFSVVVNHSHYSRELTLPDRVFLTLSAVETSDYQIPIV